MEQRKETIDRLIESKTKISIVDCAEASKEIYELYKETNDEKILVAYLFEGTYKVASQFMSDFYKGIEEEKQIKIAHTIIKEMSIVDEKISKSLTGFSIVRTLLDINIKEHLLDILSVTIKLAASGSGFTANICKGFKSHLLDPVGKEILQLDYSGWSLGENERLFKLIRKSEKDLGKVTFLDELNVWIKTYLEGASIKPIEATQKPKNEATCKLIAQVSTAVIEDSSLDKVNLQADKLMKNLLSATEEIEKLFDNVFSKNITLNNQRDRLKDQDIKILNLQDQVDKQKDENLVLNSEIETLRRSLEEKSLKIEGLDNRLKESFQSDEISQNQELITLKKNIAAAVKLQYEDFSENEDAECNEDNYTALKIGLNNVFRALDRYGIEL